MYNASVSSFFSLQIVGCENFENIIQNRISAFNKKSTKWHVLIKNSTNDTREESITEDHEEERITEESKKSVSLRNQRGSYHCET